ncbi:MAG: hypothetical protein AAFQ81_03860 [Pseudomonadota bacterium]
MNESLQTQYEPYYRRAHELRAEETRRLALVVWNAIRAIGHSVAKLYPVPRRRVA